MQKYFLNVK